MATRSCGTDGGTFVKLPDPIEDRRLFSLGLLAGVAAVLLSPMPQARGDVSTEVLSGATIEDAVASPASVGGTSRLRFRIENYSGGSLTLTGVHFRVAGRSAIVMRSPVVGARDIEALVIRQNETLDLQSSHIWLELRDLSAPIRDGDTVRFDLQFLTGRLQADAHAHE